MINTAICGNDRWIRIQLKKRIEMLQPNWKLFLYSSEEELEKEMLEKNFSIFFIDVKAGYEFSKTIRTYNANAVVILISGYETDVCEEAFEIDAIRFLKKPFDNVKLDEAIRKANQIISNQNIYFSYKKRGVVYRVQLSNVYFFERKQRTLEMHLVFGKIEKIYTSLKSLEEKLDAKYFVRTHASYIVNVAYITAIKESVVILENGEYIPVARTRKQEVLNVYSNYLNR